MSFPTLLRFLVTGLCLLALLSMLSRTALAQYEYANEAYAGYSFVHFKPGEDLDSTGMSGWNASLSGYVNDWMGFAADFSQQFGSTPAPLGLDSGLKVDVQQWSYLFGPEVRPLRTDRYAVSFRTLLGASRGDADPSTFIIDGQPYRLSVKATKFAAAIGGALDYNITERVALRILPSYFLTSFSRERQNNFLISTGILYRFGDRE